SPPRSAPLPALALVTKKPIGFCGFVLAQPASTASAAKRTRGLVDFCMMLLLVGDERRGVVRSRQRGRFAQRARIPAMREHAYVRGAADIPERGTALADICA